MVRKNTGITDKLKRFQLFFKFPGERGFLDQIKIPTDRINSTVMLRKAKRSSVERDVFGDE